VNTKSAIHAVLAGFTLACVFSGGKGKEEENIREEVFEEAYKSYVWSSNRAAHLATSSSNVLSPFVYCSALSNGFGNQMQAMISCLLHGFLMEVPVIIKTNFGRYHSTSLPEREKLWNNFHFSVKKINVEHPEVLCDHLSSFHSSPHDPPLFFSPVAPRGWDWYGIDLYMNLELTNPTKKTKVNFTELALNNSEHNRRNWIASGDSIPPNFYQIIWRNSFRLRSKYMKIVDSIVATKFGKYTIAIQMRKNDHERLYSEPNVPAMLGTADLLAREVVGRKKGNSYISYDDIRFFVATQDPEALDSAKSFFGEDKVVAFDGIKTAGGMEVLEKREIGAIVMEVMSRCDDLVVTWFSSYGTNAAARAGITPVACFEKSCYRKLVPMPFTQVEQQPTHECFKRWIKDL